MPTAGIEAKPTGHVDACSVLRASARACRAGRRRKEAEVPHGFHGAGRRPVTRLGGVVLRPGRRVQDRSRDARTRARHLPGAARVLGRRGRCAVRGDRLRSAPQAALHRRAERPLRDRERPRLRECRRDRRALRLRDDLPVRPRRRRIHHRDDEDGGDPDRDRPAGAAVPAQRLGADRDPDGGIRARRHHLRHVGGDARLLRPARAAGAGAGLRPHGRRRDHLPRRRHRRPVLHREPVRDRRRLGCGGHQPGGRDRRARPDVDRARRAGDRLRDPLRIAGRQGPFALGRRNRTHRRGRRQGSDLGRARALRAPEARAGPVRRLVPGDDLRLHPLERPLAGGLGQATSRCRPSARSTSRRRRRCSS